MVQQLEFEENGSGVQSLKEIKKSRRTMMLGSALQLPNAGSGVDLTLPLTPPLSDRASGDVEQLFSPEREERYESVDLSSEEDAEWDHSEQQSATEDSDEVYPSYLCTKSRTLAN
jgi:hypothetical protein